MEVKKVTPVYDRLANSTSRTVVCKGGARSSKSYSIAQLIIFKLINERNKKIGITRKTFPALRRTAYDLIISLLKDYGIYEESCHNKSYFTYEFGTNRIEFFGMDEPEKLKSTGFNYIWMEETNEFTLDDYTTLWLRLSEPTNEGERNQIFLSFNPIDENNWIAKDLVNRDNVEIISSTYKDNPFLEREYVESLENEIEKDSNYYRVYVLGEWGSLDNLIYSNYEVVNDLPEFESAKFGYGLDFGTVNESALCKVYLVNGEIYLDERFYKSHMTISDIIERLSHEDRGDIYADPTSLQIIEEISQAGYNIYAAPRDVRATLDLCLRQKLHITAQSTNLLKEIRGYQRRTAYQNGEKVVLEEPIKRNDHLMDAMRYGIYGLVSRYGYATAVPRDSYSNIHSFSPKKRVGAGINRF